MDITLCVLIVDGAELRLEAAGEEHPLLLGSDLEGFRVLVADPEAPLAVLEDDQAIAILGPPVKPKGVAPIAWQAQRQGLPTDPEAYQDGGLAVAATAFDLEEAHIIANALRQAEIPAWVEGESMAGWYWHLQMGLHRGGIRVLVPAARLAEAQGIMERDRQEAAAALAPEPESDEKDEAAYQLWRSAQRLGFFTALGFTAPVAFFRAIRLLDKIREERKRIGNLPDLRRARRLAWLIILTIVPLALFTLLMLAMMAVR